MAIQGETRQNTRIKIREPKQYKVIMHNDDFTTMDFVVDILREFFHKNEMEAERLMLLRSEERSVGKECRSRWSQYH